MKDVYFYKRHEQFVHDPQDGVQKAGNYSIERYIQERRVALCAQENENEGEKRKPLKDGDRETERTQKDKLLQAPPPSFLSSPSLITCPKVL